MSSGTAAWEKRGVFGDVGWRERRTSPEGIADVCPVSREEELDPVGLEVLRGVLITDEAELGNLQAFGSGNVSKVCYRAHLSL